MRKAKVNVNDRHSEISTNSNLNIKFKSVSDLLTKIDNNLDKLPYGKVDVEIENEGQFSDDEINILENEFIYVS